MAPSFHFPIIHCKVLQELFFQLLLFMVPSSVGFNTHCFSEGLHGVDILVELLENLDCVISPKVLWGALGHGLLAVFIVIAPVFFSSFNWC